VLLVWGESLANINLGKVIEKIIGKIRKEEEEPAEETLLDVPTASTPPASPSVPAAPSMPDIVYLKAPVLHSIEDLDKFKSEVESGNILIVRVGPLAEKNIEDVKRAVAELCEFTDQIGGDIARLGEERVVITPSFVKIWREETAESESETSTEGG
jgi:SepF-like predicted cell division protein (DUF552 family)